MEPWITPVFFEAVNVGDLRDKVVDEWTYAELLDPMVYKARMLGHWNTFVVKSHFEELSTAGISHVRSIKSAHAEMMILIQLSESRLDTGTGMSRMVNPSPLTINIGMTPAARVPYSISRELSPGWMSWVSRL